MSTNSDRREKSIDSALWVTSVGGAVLGVLLTVMGIVFLGTVPGVLVVGLLFLAAGVGAHFVRTGRRR